MKTKRQFTLVEIVVVISIISILIGISFVSANIAKSKAKYTKWLTYNTMLSKDPDTVINFNFADTDAKIAGEPALTNSAVGCGVQGFDPKLSNGLIKNAKWVKKGGRSRFHHALQFDGRRSYVEIQNNKALDFDAEKEDFTIMMWVRFDSISSTRVLCGKAEWSRISQYDLYLNARRLEADVGRSCTAWKTPQVSAGKWHHVALVSEGGKFQIYLDSAAMGSPAKGSPSSQNITSKPLTLGAIFTTGNSRTPRYNFQGRMDEFILIRKALSPAEIKHHFDAGNYNDSGNTAQAQALPSPRPLPTPRPRPLPTPRPRPLPPARQAPETLPSLEDTGRLLNPSAAEAPPAEYQMRPKKE